MPVSHPTRWIVFFLSGALSVLGCVGSTDAPQGETGSLSLDLVLMDDVLIKTVVWRITGNGMDMDGTIDVSAPRSTASVEVYGLPKGEDEDYTITLEAESMDGDVTCKGSEQFNVEAGETEYVMVMLRCKLPQRLGAVRVNGEFNICAELIKATAAPLRTSVGNDIDLFAQGIDRDSDDIHYRWTGSGGSIDDPDAPSTTYTCLDVGENEITISVTDNDEYCDMATWKFDVTCVPGEAECQSNEECDAGEVCVAGQCVPDVECITPDNCDDENDCTADICADGVCSNPNLEPDESCNQDGGSFCDGEGNCVECNVDPQCDMGEMCTENACVPEVECVMDSQCDDGNQCTVDTCTAGECSNPNQEAGATCDQDGGSVCDGEGTCVACNIDDDCSTDEVCVVNTCVGDPNLFCNEGLCLTNETARANCIEAFLECVALEPANEEECLLLGLAQCNVECLIDEDCNAGEVCTDEVCVPDVMCMMDSQCDDGNQCTVDTCTAGECSNPNQEAGATCDQDGGSVCDDNGACVACNIDDDCGTDEVCVVNTCVGDPNLFCNEGLCLTNETARANCIEAFLECVALEPANEEECLLLGVAECSLECIDDIDCDMGEICVDNVCEMTQVPVVCEQFNPNPAQTGQNCDGSAGQECICEKPEFLAVDCELLGNSAPIPLASSVQQLGVAFAGSPATILPQDAVVLPSALICSFIGAGFSEAIVDNSFALATYSNASIPDTQLNSFLDDGTAGGDPNSPHNPVTFDFGVACGDNCVGGVCTSDGTTTCSLPTFTQDCPGVGTGPGILAPTFAGSPDVIMAPDFTEQLVTLTPTAPGTVDIGLPYSGIALNLPAVGNPPLAAGCVGGACGTGTNLAPLCSPITRGTASSPRTMYDATCSKIDFGDGLCEPFFFFSTLGDICKGAGIDAIADFNIPSQLPSCTEGICGLLSTPGDFFCTTPAAVTACCAQLNTDFPDVTAAQLPQLPVN